MRNVAIGLLALTLLSVRADRASAQPAVAPFRGDVEKLAKQNSDFRRVLFTGAHVQIVAMSILPDEEIGAEVHQVDQCFFFVEGEGQTVVAGKLATVKEDDVLCVPAGMRHNVSNSGRKPLKLYTLYSPPQHPAGTVHHTKADAAKAEAKPAH